ncbi:MAG: hypothetical protein SGPRY_001878 [Prymnesium sp.]
MELSRRRVLQRELLGGRGGGEAGGFWGELSRHSLPSRRGADYRPLAPLFTANVPWMTFERISKSARAEDWEEEIAALEAEAEVLRRWALHAQLSPAPLLPSSWWLKPRHDGKQPPFGKGKNNQQLGEAAATVDENPGGEEGGNGDHTGEVSAACDGQEKGMIEKAPENETKGVEMDGALLERCESVLQRVLRGEEEGVVCERGEEKLSPRLQGEMCSCLLELVRVHTQLRKKMLEGEARVKEGGGEVGGEAGGERESEVEEADGQAADVGSLVREKVGREREVFAEVESKREMLAEMAREREVLAEEVLSLVRSLERGAHRQLQARCSQASQQGASRALETANQLVEAREQQLVHETLRSAVSNAAEGPLPGVGSQLEGRLVEALAGADDSRALSAAISLARLPPSPEEVGGGGGLGSASLAVASRRVVELLGLPPPTEAVAPLLSCLDRLARRRAAAEAALSVGAVPMLLAMLRGEGEGGEGVEGGNGDVEGVGAGGEEEGEGAVMMGGEVGEGGVKGGGMGGRDERGVGAGLALCSLLSAAGREQLRETVGPSLARRLLSELFNLLNSSGPLAHSAARGMGCLIESLPHLSPSLPPSTPHRLATKLASSHHPSFASALRSLEAAGVSTASGMVRGGGLPRLILSLHVNSPANTLAASGAQLDAMLRREGGVGVRACLGELGGVRRLCEVLRNGRHAPVSSWRVKCAGRWGRRSIEGDVGKGGEEIV